MLRVNHFPLRGDVRVGKSCYRHINARAYCRYLRRAGYDATEQAGHVIVFHAEGTEPDAKLRPVAREVVSAGSPRKEYGRGINALIDHLLRRSGFIRVGAHERREYISPSDHVRSLVIEERGPSLPSLNAHSHLRWTWELEWFDGVPWLVPLPSRCFLTAQGPQFPALMRWLRLRVSDGERIKGIDLKTGNHRTLTLRAERWGTEAREGWEPLHGDGWRVCLDMRSLQKLGYSVEAFHSAQFSFDELHEAFRRSSPFVELVATTDPCTPGDGRIGTVPGSHLRFRNGTHRQMKEVHRLGILEPPPRPVRILVVASKQSEDATRETRNVLAAHLIDRATLTARSGGQNSLRAVGASDGRDTIATIWTKNKYGRGFGLPSFSLANTRLHFYDRESGTLLSREALEAEAKAALREGVTLIAVVLLDDDLPTPQHDRLMREFSSMKACPITFSSLAKRSASAERSVDPKWLNFALMLSQKAGAVPWDLTDLPRMDEKTVFLGIDLGHNYARNRSHIAFTLFDHRGRPLDHRIVSCARNDERIPSDVLQRELPGLIFGQHDTSPTTVIVHRDGRFLDGESDDIIGELQDEILLLTLVAVKKDTCTRMIGEPLEGAFLELGKSRAVLVTNVQARCRSMPVPLEIEMVYTNHLSLQETVSQVFWLTRVCQANAFSPRRLPATTGWANNLAATGHRRHLKGWEHCE